MKFMLIMRTTDAAAAANENADFEAVINAMGEYNDAMIAAGVLLSGDGLAPEPGAVVDFDFETPEVTDGPYGDTPALFHGFWIIKAAGLVEATDWARKCPLGPGNKIEVRRITDESDFEDFADNEHIQKEAELRAQMGE